MGIRRRAGALAAVAALALGGMAAAQERPGRAAMVEKVREIGIAIGNAYSCTEEEARGLFKEESHHLFDLILQDVGSDMAFIYAAALGFGGAVPREELDCPALLEQWEGMRVDYGLKADAE